MNILSMSLAGLVFFSCAAAAQETSEYTYSAKKSPSLGHATGRAYATAWGADTQLDQANHLVYGPYINTLTEGFKTAEFKLNIENNLSSEDVAILDVYDASSQQQITSKTIYANDFSQPGIFQSFKINFSTFGRSGHSIETRVWWTDKLNMNVDYVKISDDQPCTGELYHYFDSNNIQRSTCYYISTNNLTWADAKQACNDSYGGTLAYIPDAQADALIKSLISSATYIGINDINQEGTWVWDGGPSVYTGWQPGEPNSWGGDQDCGYISTHYNAWDDGGCAAEIKYACSVNR